MRSRSLILAALLAAACGTESARPSAEPTSTASTFPSSTNSSSPATGAPVALLPSVPGYTARDDVDTSELTESLAHGTLQVEAVDRRLIVDGDGFTLGEILLVVFPDHAPRQDYVAARFPDTTGETIEIAGTEMTDLLNGVLVWDRGSSVVTFQRGQEQSDAWLHDLAAATVRAMSA